MRKKLIATLFFLIALAFLFSSAYYSGFIRINGAPPPNSFVQLPPPPPNYNAIEPNLYIGGYVAAPPPGTQAVLTLSRNKDPYTTEIYQASPIDDAAPAPTLDWLKEQVAFVAAQQTAGRCTYVHCDAGISRSALVTTAYLMARDHITRDQALDYIRTRRPIANPNRAFMVLLNEWEDTLNPDAPRPRDTWPPLQPGESSPPLKATPDP
jgi:hypothetical protein